MKYRLAPFVLIPILLVAVSMGCESVGPVADTDLPVVRILSPGYSPGGQYYSHPDSNNTLEIRAEVSDNDELHEVDLRVMQYFLDDQIPRGYVYSRHFHPDAPEMAIAESWTIDTAFQSDIWIQVIANDHNGNTAKDSVMVHVDE